jgi:hypothetical protein
LSEEQAIVSLATADDFYAICMARLERSLDRVGFTGVRELWRPRTFPAECPAHYESPFAFKPFCLAEAGVRGLRRLLWLDANCMVIRPLDKIFDQIATSGYVLFRNGSHKVGEWASDSTLTAFGLDRDAALELPEVNAGAIGLNLDNKLAATFLARWKAAAQDGTTFRGGIDPINSRDDYEAMRWNREGRCSLDRRVKGHRHDQTVAGNLAHELGMELSVAGLQPYRRVRGPIRPTTAVVKCGAPRRFETAQLLLGRVRGQAGAWAGRARAHDERQR